MIKTERSESIALDVFCSTKGYLKIKYSGATRACLLGFIERRCRGGMWARPLLLSLSCRRPNNLNHTIFKATMGTSLRLACLFCAVKPALYDPVFQAPEILLHWLYFGQALSLKASAVFFSGSLLRGELRVYMDSRFDELASLVLHRRRGGGGPAHLRGLLDHILGSVGDCGGGTSSLSTCFGLTLWQCSFVSYSASFFVR